MTHSSDSDQDTPAVGSGEFARATAVHEDRRGDRPGASGDWSARIADGWDILGNTNGGYVLSMLSRAMSRSLGSLEPITVTGHYLAPVTAGPVRIETAVLKQGRTLSTASATVFAGERPLATALGSYGRHNVNPEVLLVDASPPDLPDPQNCVRMRRPPGMDPAEPMPPPFAERIDLRFHPDDAGFMAGRPTGTPRFRAWFRLPYDPLDVTALLLAADSLPPTTFNSGLPIAWTPTVELTVQVRSAPRTGWLMLDFATRFISHGRLEVDGLVWDESGDLVAQSRQLALVPHRG